MRAVQVTTLKGPAALAVAEVAEPQLSSRKVVIEVEAAGVNFPDVLMSKGEYQMRPDPPFVLGSEVAGRVIEAAAGSEFAPGDRVAAFPGLGGFAERAVADEVATFPLAEEISYEEGASLLMNYLTVQFALKRRGRLQSGESVLVHGAAGGIGTAGIQLAKAYGARVLAVTSSPEKADFALAAGADEVLEVEGFKDRAKALTGGQGVDVVLDPVGGERFTDSLRSLRPEGRLLVVGFTGGEIPTVKVNRLLLNNLDVVGVGWGAFWLKEPSLLRSQWDEVAGFVARGEFKPPVGARFSLDQASEALISLEQRAAKGKVVLCPR
jgi:NADPH2:quinone reductase